MNKCEREDDMSLAVNTEHQKESERDPGGDDQYSIADKDLVFRRSQRLQLQRERF